MMRNSICKRISRFARMLAVQEFAGVLYRSHARALCMSARTIHREGQTEENGEQCTRIDRCAISRVRATSNGLVRGFFH
jgi:hypothetical protein